MIGLSWLALHAAGMGSVALYGPVKAFPVYLAVFLLAEAVGLLTGHPMTKYVRRFLKRTRQHAVRGTLATFAIWFWCTAFVVLCVGYGPLGTVWNALLAVVILGNWLVGHFFGDRW